MSVVPLSELLGASVRDASGTVRVPHFISQDFGKWEEATMTPESLVLSRPASSR